MYVLDTQVGVVFEQFAILTHDRFNEHSKITAEIENSISFTSGYEIRNPLWSAFVIYVSTIRFEELFDVLNFFQQRRSKARPRRRLHPREKRLEFWVIVQF